MISLHHLLPGQAASLWLEDSRSCRMMSQLRRMQTEVMKQLAERRASVELMQDLGERASWMA